MTMKVPIVICVILSAVIALALSRTSADAMPQIAVGNDALAFLFADARSVISVAALQQADSYFHGGVEIDCGHLQHHHDHDEHGEHHEHDENCEHHDHDEHECCGHEHCGHQHGDSGCCEHDHGCCGHDHDHDDGEAGEESGGDWWAWINSHIRAPQVDRHLDSEKAVELMPWLMASTSADPHNAEAWSMAWYVAYSVMGRRDLAASILEEGLLKNPDSPELHFVRGRVLYNRGEGDLAAALAAFRKVRELAVKKCGGDLSRLDEHAEEAYRFAGNYIDFLEAKERRE